jgi:hypothetical protein
MNLVLLTWNSISIQDSNITAYFPKGQKTNLQSDVVTVNRADNFPSVSGRVLLPHTLIIGIQIQPGANINTYRELIKKYFAITDRNRHNLIAKDTDNSNTQYYVTGYPVRINNVGDDENHFTIGLRLEYPYWQLVTASVDSWDITASGDSDAITNAGNINVPPVFTFTPTTTKTAGYKYRRYVSIYNKLDKSYISPLDITNGGLDVQSLINANKMQADGDDFRVWEDGSFKDRWLYEMDSDSDPALCWVNYSLSPRKEATTLSTFDSDDTTISLTQTRASLAFLRNLKSVTNHTFLVDSEEVVYDPDNISILNFQITSLSRGQKNTTAVTHSASSTIRHIEHDLWFLYGDSDATAPDVDSDFKPIFNLSSTNQLWNYTNFYDTTSDRPGEWIPEVQSTKTKLSDVYTDSDGNLVNPSTKLGLSMQGGPDFQISNEAGTIDWLFYHPADITNVKYSGDYRTVDSDNSWPATVGLQYLQTNGQWKLAYSDSDFPAMSSDSWVAFDSVDITISEATNNIRFVMDGQLNSVLNAKAQFHADTVFTTFDSSDIPSITVGSEGAINFFEFILTNASNGSEYIKVVSPCPVNTALTVDCVNKKAYLADGTKVNVILSSNREAWLDLVPGTNNLNYVDVGTVAVHVTVTHRDRVL